MPELLLEIGCEELPAAFVAKASEDLRGLVLKALEEARLSPGAATAYATPRRLIVSISDVASTQSDLSEEKRGPALKGAFDADGQPTKALDGFLRGQGLTLADVRKDDQYVWVTKFVAGAPARDTLGPALESAIRGLTFPKTMRWGSGRFRFARPIRWILAAFDGQAVPMTLEGVTAGLESRGHRFYHPESFPATSLESLLEGLRERKVEPCPKRRAEMILEATKAVTRAGEAADIHDDLLDENVHLTEWPQPILGEFPEAFMELPEAVLITAMAKHERMFPVRDGEKKLVNRFVFVRNSGVDDTVRRGAEWVLNARFNDARFFHDLDASVSMDAFREKTGGILFGEKLGTVLQRSERLERLADRIAAETGANETERAYARLAGRYAKADLASGLVSELASLQGVVGGIYARREGMPGAVAWALHSQYRPDKNPDPANCEGERTALRLIMADALDKLAGYLGLGKEPSGSSDPFGLRRAVTTLIEAAWGWPSPLPPFASLFDLALDEYGAQGIALDRDAAKASLRAIFANRYGHLMPDVRHDVMAGALGDAGDDLVTEPRRIRLRAHALGRLATDDAFVSTASRPINLVAAARKKGLEIPASVEGGALNSPEGEALLGTLNASETAATQALRDENPDTLVGLAHDLKAPIDRFVDGTMIMSDDPAERAARLALCDLAARRLALIGDVSALEG